MIILFGVVGSGKSEQAARLVAKLNCPYISTSQLIREKNNPQWNKIINVGNLLSDKDIFELLEPELAKVDAVNKEFILDGAPRSITQAKWLLEKIRHGKIELTAIIYLKVSKDLVLQRLLARGRYDDKKEIIARRFERYDNITAPVLQYFRQQGCTVYEIDGSLSIDDVENQIWQIIKDKVNAS